MGIGRVHHINCGTMCPLAGRGLPWRRGHLVCHCLLIESDQGLILVDTGFCPADIGKDGPLAANFQFVTKPDPDGPTAKSAIEALGYTCDDVRFVVPTHLDLDHAGGLAEFPKAAVHIFQREFDEAMSPSKGHELRYIQAHWGHGPDWKLHDPDGESWQGFESVRPIPGLEDELAMIPLYGHSAGNAGIATKDGEGWLLHAGDAFFHHKTLEAKNRAPWGLRLIERLGEFDRKARLHNHQRLRDLHAAHGDTIRIICSHDPAQLGSLSGVAGS